MFYVGMEAVEPGELLFHDDFTDPDMKKRWEIGAGDWSCKDGVCKGSYRGEGGLIYTYEQFPGDIMLDYYGKLVPPCTNDLNFTFRAEGWDYENNTVLPGYIGGLNGWWTDNCGLERYPNCIPQALSPLFKAESGVEYHIQTGIIGSTCFLAVDGKLLISMTDPNPIDNPKSNRVGLGVYVSQIEVRDFKVYRPKLTHKEMGYTPNF